MAEILIYDFIGEDFFGEGVTAKKIKAELDAIPVGEEITVRINSGGGDVFDGFAIYNLLSGRDVDVVVDGLAASAASVIAMAGKTITMAENALMMIHDPWTFAIGNSDEMMRTAELLEKIKGSILNNYISKTGLDRDLLSDAMSAETWYSADEAIASGFADSTVEEKRVAMNTKFPWIKNCPMGECEEPEAHSETAQAQPEQFAPEYRIAARARLKDLVS